ncbi:hypothetical protein [Mesorhizobium helmanticense]|uniref:Uncharacterized protein n=1 Tax=Mesorhizobium helmanticense TaxID=1776423 RepID=A0A2T4ISN1_9HYPH|nr:hypothetical protein [Mesorhizobium helmanticense]PTE08637.1 hypothetical protein C9427_20360 [Mesorhizobium helmanticense]
MGDFLPLGALCLGASSTSAECEFSDSPHQVFALPLMQQNDHACLWFRCEPLTILQGLGALVARWQPQKSVIEKSVHAGLADLTQRHNSIEGRGKFTC